MMLRPEAAAADAASMGRLFEDVDACVMPRLQSLRATISCRTSKISLCLFYALAGRICTSRREYRNASRYWSRA